MLHLRLFYLQDEDVSQLPLVVAFPKDASDGQLHTYTNGEH